MFTSLAYALAACVSAPLLPGLVNKTKALVGGRRGPPLFQLYFDLGRLLRKGQVISRTTTWVFGAAPSVVLAACVTAMLLVPSGGRGAAISFPGDLLLFAGLLALARFAMIAAALDTGSAFEGMGASREATFGALAEIALVLSLAALARATGSFSLTGSLGALSAETWAAHAPALGLVAAAVFVVFLTENARIPVDDPATHLELTMIHEVMILDHSGADLAMLEYASSLKLWLLATPIVAIVLPVHSGDAGRDAIAFACGMAGVAVVTGFVESAMARLRLSRVPALLGGAAGLAGLALLLGAIG